jgi:hypothetical protein
VSDSVCTSQPPRHFGRAVRTLVFLSAGMALLLSATSFAAAQTMPSQDHKGALQPKRDAVKRSSSSRASKAAPTTGSATPETPDAAPPPPPPAVIETAPDSLTIRADGASLTQTLQRIADKTGMKVNGVANDEHIFGTYGPGNPREVLTALLYGTPYNVIMDGALASGAPRELLLSPKPTGSAGVAAAPAEQPAQSSPDEDSDAPADESDLPPPPGPMPSIAPSTPQPPEMP